MERLRLSPCAAPSSAPTGSSAKARPISAPRCRPGGSSGGFTLIELMIVVVIMAILATASVAGYRQYVRRANRVDATSALLRVSAAQERFYLQNNRYATTREELADPPPGRARHRRNRSGALRAGRGRRRRAVPSPGYRATATATPGGSQRDDDDCQAFSIDQSGRRGAAGCRWRRERRRSLPVAGASPLAASWRAPALQEEAVKQQQARRRR